MNNALILLEKEKKLFCRIEIKKQGKKGKILGYLKLEIEPLRVKVEGKRKNRYILLWLFLFFI